MSTAAASPLSLFPLFTEAQFLERLKASLSDVAERAFWAGFREGFLLGLVSILLLVWFSPRAPRS